MRPSDSDDGILQRQEEYDIEKELANRLRNSSKEERRVLYSAVYDELNRRAPWHRRATLAQRVTSAALKRAAASQMRLLQSFVKPEDVVLEIGPGDFELAMEVAKRVKKVYVVDVTSERVKKIILPKNVEFRLSDGSSLPVPMQSINIVYSNQVMEHLHPDDASDQLQNIVGVLVPRGKYICITPNRIAGPHDISKYFDEVATGLHLKEYTVTEVADMLRRTGFSKVKTFLSYKGYIVSPLLPVTPFAWIEWILEKLPRALRKRVAILLVAVKIVAIK